MSTEHQEVWSGAGKPENWGQEAARLSAAEDMQWEHMS